MGALGDLLEMTIDADVGILIETGIRLEARFGLGAAFVNREIMVKKTDSPLEGFDGLSMLKSMSTTLGLFDEFTVRYTGCRPSLREMVGV